MFLSFLFPFSVRVVLASLVLHGLSRFRLSLSRLFGSATEKWFVLITASQFHFLYYISRPLPNTFGLIFVLHALHHCLQGNGMKFVLFSGVAAIIFRAEVVLLLGIIALMDIAFGKLSFSKVLLASITFGTLILAISVSVDSWFWKRPLWPEGEVLYFNVYLNKSSQWGVSPWAWYFYSVLPRALFLSLPLAALGVILEPRLLRIAFPAVLFIFFFSFLPHKELRFIIYTFPIFNVASACACQRLWQNRRKSWTSMLLASFVLAHLIGNLAFTSLMVHISSHNYPGGHALQRLHEIEKSSHISVHIDNYSCQSGVTRFGELGSQWVYDKREEIDLADAEIFDYLLVEKKEASFYQERFKVMDEIEAYDRVNFNYYKFPPLEIKRKTAICIMKQT